VLNNNDTIENSVKSDAPATEAELATVAKIKASKPRVEHPDEFWVATLRMISPECVERVNTILATTGAVVVISSAWRNLFAMETLRMILEHHGFQGQIVDKTPTKMSLYGREREIQMWFIDSKDDDAVVKYTDIENFVILDDDPGPGFDWAWPNNSVTTDFEVGLDDAGMNRAIEILNGANSHGL
jgi:hypothetical protein